MDVARFLIGFLIVVGILVIIAAIIVAIHSFYYGYTERGWWSVGIMIGTLLAVIIGTIALSYISYGKRVLAMPPAFTDRTILYDISYPQQSIYAGAQELPYEIVPQETNIFNTGLKVGDMNLGRPYHQRAVLETDDISVEMLSDRNYYNALSNKFAGRGKQLLVKRPNDEMLQWIAKNGLRYNTTEPIPTFERGLFDLKIEIVAVQEEIIREWNRIQQALQDTTFTYDSVRETYKVRGSLENHIRYYNYLSKLYIDQVQK